MLSQSACKNARNHRRLQNCWAGRGARICVNVRDVTKHNSWLCRVWSWRTLTGATCGKCANVLPSQHRGTSRQTAVGTDVRQETIWWRTCPSTTQRWHRLCPHRSALPAKGHWDHSNTQWNEWRRKSSHQGRSWTQTERRTGGKFVYAGAEQETDRDLRQGKLCGRLVVDALHEEDNRSHEGALGTPDGAVFLATVHSLCKGAPLGSDCQFLGVGARAHWVRQKETLRVNVLSRGISRTRRRLEHHVPARTKRCCRRQQRAPGHNARQHRAEVDAPSKNPKHGTNGQECRARC